MKSFKWTVLLLLSLIFISCTKKQDEPKDYPKDEILRTTQMTIEKYDSAKVTKETVVFTYENENDPFWIKKEFRDEDGNVYRTEDVTLDENRLPARKVVTDELGTTTEQYEFKYSPETYDILEKTEYEGDISQGKKIRNIKYNYDNGYLTSEEVTKYSPDSAFKNADGNNIVRQYKLRYVIPHENRPKGNHDTPYYIESQKMYYTPEMAKSEPIEGLNPGDVYFEAKTEFDDRGYPIHYTSTQPVGNDKPEDHHSTEEWYKSDDSGIVGKLLSIESYEDKDFSKASFSNAKDIFEYDEKGMIKTVTQFKYNDTTGKFDLLHDKNDYEWQAPALNSMYDYTRETLKNEHRCYHRLIHSWDFKEVKKYTDGEIVILERSASYPLGEAPQKPELKDTKKTTIKYEVKKLKPVPEKES